ncbi:MAG: hypothetical protein QY323_01000 [Patescibacteria group bacterium]|nr:MAG: hypothetical protein QY323_01000 [Patescibacteria group bacterium]
MWKFLLHAALAVVGTIVQISFLSQLPFPFSAISLPIVAIAYGIVRDRPVISAGWALLGGLLLDLHGLLGFGSEMLALFVAFFATRFLFQRVVTNTGTPALFLIAAAAATIRWFTLAALDGVNVLFGGVPVLIDLSATALLAPVRQSLVAGGALLAYIGVGSLLSRRFQKTFLSHAPHAFSRH